MDRLINERRAVYSYAKYNFRRMDKIARIIKSRGKKRRMRFIAARFLNISNALKSYLIRQRIKMRILRISAQQAFISVVR